MKNNDIQQSVSNNTVTFSWGSNKSKKNFFLSFIYQNKSEEDKLPSVVVITTAQLYSAKP